MSIGLKSEAGFSKTKWDSKRNTVPGTARTKGGWQAFAHHSGYLVAVVNSRLQFCPTLEELLSDHKSQPILNRLKS